jgi:hypothetical protein
MIIKNEELVRKWINSILVYFNGIAETLHLEWCIEAFGVLWYEGNRACPDQDSCETIVWKRLAKFDTRRSYIPCKLRSWIPEYSAMVTGEWNEGWNAIYFTGSTRSDCVALKISRECDSLETLLFMTLRLTQLGLRLMHSSGYSHSVSNDTFSLKGEIYRRQNL